MDAKSSVFDSDYYLRDGYIIDDKGYRYYNFVTTDGKNVPIEDAVNLLKNTNNDSEYNRNIGMYGVVGPDNGVTITNIQKKYVGKEQRITPDVIGPAEISKTVSTTVSASVTASGSVSVGVKAAVLGEVRVECGVAVSIGTAKTDSFTVKFPVNSGKKAAIYFKPYCVKATAKVNNKNYTAICPKMIGSFADGVFYIKER